MLKYQVEPYKEFAQNYYINRDTAHDFRHIERIINRLETPMSKRLAKEKRTYTKEFFKQLRSEL